MFIECWLIIAGPGAKQDQLSLGSVLICNWILIKNLVDFEHTFDMKSKLVLPSSEILDHKTKIYSWVGVLMVK